MTVIDVKQTGIRIRFLMKMRHISASDVQKELSLECVQSVYRWLSGINLPTVDNLYALSEILKVPMDVLIVGNSGYRPYRYKQCIDDATICCFLSIQDYFLMRRVA